MNFITGVGYILRSIIALVAIIVLANFLLKKLQVYSEKQAKTIQIIERISVSKSSALALAKIGGQYYMMSLTETSSEILKEFSPEEAKTIELELEESKREQSTNTDIKDSMKNVREKYQKMFENK